MSESSPTFNQTERDIDFFDGFEHEPANASKELDTFRTIQPVRCHRSIRDKIVETIAFV
ncbi:hypothetical protein AAE478_005297 [Parahypoxylon ruwenzoriense]